MSEKNEITGHRLTYGLDREIATRESDFQLNEEEEDDEKDDWEGDNEWNNEGEDAEGDVKDESAAYLDFLNEEVRILHRRTKQRGGIVLTWQHNRPRDSVWRMTMTTIWKKRAYLKHLLIRLSRTDSLRRS